MPSFLNLKNSMLALASFGLLAFTHGTAKADPISVCTGPACSTTNVTGTIVAGNGTVTIRITLVVPGVTVNSTFSDVVIQFGTKATPPETLQTQEPASMLLMGTGLIGVAAGLRRHFRKK